MAPAGRALLIICFTCGGWAFSFGLGTQVVTHWLKAHGARDAVIGLNHSTYYLGIALASLFVPWLTRRWGNRCAAAGMIVSGTSLALFPWAGGLPGWFLLRLINGMAGAMSLIPLETLVSRDSKPEERTRNFACYAVALTLGGALGIGTGLDLYRPGGTLAFYLGGAVPLTGGLVLARSLRFSIAGSDLPVSSTSVDWGRNFLSYGTAWCQGFLEGGMLAFLSLYLLSLGLSRNLAGGLMSVTMVGVILFQVPVSWLADRLGRVAVLLGCYAMVAAGLLLLPFCGQSVWLAVCLFLFGACSGAMYPLGLALLGDRLPEAGLARAYAWYLAMECLGSQLGAAAMGQARDTWGEASMFGVGLAAVMLVLVCWGAIQIRQKRKASTASEALPLFSGEPKEDLRPVA